MELTYNGSYGGILHPELEVGHGMPYVSSALEPSRGLQYLGTFAGRERELAELDAWKPGAYNLGRLGPAYTWK